jgi:hypothetical protein
MPGRDFLSFPAVAAAAARVFERSACPPPPRPFVRGHINPDAVLDISDPVFLLNYLFTGGPAPACEDAADSNDDGAVDLSDSITLFSYLFLGTARPDPPFPDPGLDTTPDALAPCY